MFKVANISVQWKIFLFFPLDCRYAEVPTISVPAGHKMGTPTWKQELEKKNARLAKHLAVKDAGNYSSV